MTPLPPSGPGPEAPDAPTARLRGQGGLNPLWIVSLFLGVAEATMGIAATQVDGWVQGLFAVFSVLFPVAVATAFFAVLWNRPYVLYAPADYAGHTGVKEFVDAVSLPAERSMGAVESSLRAAVEEAAASRIDLPGERDALVEQVVASTRDGVRRREITIDLFSLGMRSPLVIAPTPDTTVDELLNTVYFTINHRVDPYTYGISWLLRSERSGTLYSAMGTAWAQLQDRGEFDERRLASAGIHPGAELAVVPLPQAGRAAPPSGRRGSAVQDGRARSGPDA